MLFFCKILFWGRNMNLSYFAIWASEVFLDVFRIASKLNLYDKYCKNCFVSDLFDKVNFGDN